MSKRDEKILRKVKKRAHRLDKGFSICGLRFGWTFIIGIIPGAGDVADAALNYFLVVRKAKQAECVYIFYFFGGDSCLSFTCTDSPSNGRIPGWLLSRMLFNNAISAGVGLVPLVGDIGIAAFKANSRNANLLEEYLRIRGEEFLRSQALLTEAGPSGSGNGIGGAKARVDGPREDPAVVKPGAGRTDSDLKVVKK